MSDGMVVFFCLSTPVSVAGAPLFLHSGPEKRNERACPDCVCPFPAVQFELGIVVGEELLLDLAPLGTSSESALEEVDSVKRVPLLTVFTLIELLYLVFLKLVLLFHTTLYDYEISGYRLRSFRL
jgi:hypothetical protein